MFECITEGARTSITVFVKKMNGVYTIATAVVYSTSLQQLMNDVFVFCWDDLEKTWEQKIKELSAASPLGVFDDALNTMEIMGNCHSSYLASFYLLSHIKTSDILQIIQPIMKCLEILYGAMK